MSDHSESVFHWDDSNTHLLFSSLLPETLVLTYNKFVEFQWPNLFAYC